LNRNRTQLYGVYPSKYGNKAQQSGAYKRVSVHWLKRKETTSIFLFNFKKNKMIISKRLFAFPFILMAFIFMFTNSCKKDEEIEKKDPTITWANPDDITVGTPLSAIQLNATADVEGTFVYSPAIGTVLSEGANQNLKVDFTPTDAVNNNIATKTVTINVVAKRDPTITWANPDDITVGTPLSAIQLNATADVEGTFVYSPAIGTVLSEGANQNLKVDFTPTDAVNNNTATKTVTINVLASTVTDYDGNVYYTVKIGTQTWMVENLKVTHYSNGDPIANITDSSAWTSLSSGAYCWYNNDIANKTTYGALYNWFTVNDSRNIAPTGWHVPTYADWIILNQYLGGYEVAGGKMKESGLGHWAEPNAGADNSSGFTALPSGLRSWDGTFYNLFYTCTFWSATENADDVSRAWRNGIYHNYPNSLPGDDLKRYGFSIRCVKD